MKAKFISVAAIVCVLSLVMGTASAATRRPTNDDLRRATLVTGNEFSGTGTLAGATLQSTEPQPSCGSISGSVWYRFEARDAKRFALELQSGFASIVTAYSLQEAVLAEVSCAIGQDVARIEFASGPGDVILLQVANTTPTRGPFSLSLSPSRWQERVIHDFTYERNASQTHVPLLSVHGAPRFGDPNMYDLTVGMSLQQPLSVGLLTFGVLQQKIDAELVTFPASTTSVRVVITARYDSEQQRCLIDGGQGSSCLASSPVSDPSSLADTQGGQTDLVIHITAMRNGAALVDQALAVPIAGQGGAVLP